MENNTFKLNPTDANVVELLYNAPKTGTNDYGNWFLYGVRKDGVETSFFATDALHKKLSAYSQGAKLSIQKEEYSPGKSAWTVKPLEGTTASAPTATTTRTIDERTHDIHKQVCLKLAVGIFTSNKEVGILSGADISIIEANTLALLDILEYGGKVKDLNSSNDPVVNDDMPF